MIARAFRFHGHGGLKFVFKRGKQLRSKNVSLRFVRNDRQKRCRVAIVVSKKVSKKAPERNTIRRRLYEIMRPLVLDLPAHDLVLTVYDRGVLSIDHQELSTQVKTMLLGALSQEP